MAQEQQEMSANGVNMSQQIAEAIQPVMDDLQTQITDTVKEQLGGGSSSSENGFSLDSLGNLGETLQSTLDSAVEQLQPFFQWLLEKVQQLISWIVSLFMGGSGSESGEEESEESEETEESESEEAEAQPA
jgi:hypothetical protein